VKQVLILVSLDN
jgi:hypothetical protein